MDIVFESRDHQQFFYHYMKMAKQPDAYHQSLFYTMGISEELRQRVGQWFDFEKDCIKRTCLDEGWQTGGTLRLTRLAFNLWNGYSDDRTSPYNLFDCGYGKYMLEGIKLRYPEYCRLQDRSSQQERI